MMNNLKIWWIITHEHKLFYEKEKNLFILWSVIE